MFFEEPVTLEDIVFENRNKKYGAYSLNRQRRKYLLAAFLISLAFLSTAVAVPLIHIYRGRGIQQYIDPGRLVILADINPDREVTPPPPPPAPREISCLEMNIIEEQCKDQEYLKNNIDYSE